MSHTPLGQSDLVNQYKIGCLIILSLVEDCGNQAPSPVITQGDHSQTNIGVAREREREVEESAGDGEVEADGEGEMELAKTEGIGEETGYLEDHEEGVIAL